MLLLQRSSRRPHALLPAKRAGAVVVEFALVAPVLVLLTIGMIEITRGLQVKNIISDAARSACRLAIQPGATTADVTANANSVLTLNGITASDATVTVQVNGTTAEPTAATSKNDKISVKVAIPVGKIAYVSPMFMQPASIESETLVMAPQGR